VGALCGALYVAQGVELMKGRLLRHNSFRDTHARTAFCCSAQARSTAHQGHVLRSPTIVAARTLLVVADGANAFKLDRQLNQPITQSINQQLA
jgi:hypothetical protein